MYMTEPGVEKMRTEAEGILIIADGSTEIGAAVAAKAVEDGVGIVVFEQAGRPVCEALRRMLAEDNNESRIWKVDFTTENGVREAADRFLALNLPVHGLFYNYVPDFPMIAASDMGPVNAYMDEMVRVFRCTQLLAKEMEKHGAGSIVYLGSIHDEKPFGNAAHSMYMGGLKNLSREAAICYGAGGLHCNLIELGARGGEDETYRSAYSSFYEGYAYKIPSGYVGNAQDTARLALFLLARENRYINGAEIRMDGGLILHYLDPLANEHAYKRWAVNRL